MPLWPPNLDKLSLISQFLFACTNINMAKQPGMLASDFDDYYDEIARIYELEQIP